MRNALFRKPFRILALTCGLMNLTTLILSAAQHDRRIEFPDILDYETLICDFHMHTVFSDGEVWPTIRVYEAEKDGLDSIAITDHLEWRPKSNDVVQPDSNRPYIIAKEKGDSSGLIVLNGGEVSRDMPPGHMNAIFLKDVNALFLDTPVDVIKEANRQEAFVFWNHPGWVAHQPDGVAELTDMHKKFLKEKLMHGIEIVNKTTYSEEALEIALEHNLTMIGNSDIHGLIDWEYDVPKGGHRPVTLVFAKEKSEAAIKEALIAGRTAVCINDTLVGKKEYLDPLIRQSLTVEEAKWLSSHKGKSLVARVMLQNHSSIDHILKNRSEYSLHNQSDVFVVPARSSVEVQVKVLEEKSKFTCQFEFLNAVIAPETHPAIDFTVEVDDLEK